MVSCPRFLEDHKFQWPQRFSNFLHAVQLANPVIHKALKLSGIGSFISWKKFAVPTLPYSLKFWHLLNLEPSPSIACIKSSISFEILQLTVFRLNYIFSLFRKPNHHAWKRSYLYTFYSSLFLLKSNCSILLWPNFDMVFPVYQRNLEGSLVEYLLWFKMMCCESFLRFEINFGQQCNYFFVWILSVWPILNEK